MLVLLWEEGVVTLKIQKYCNTHWYRRAGSNKAFFYIMQCHCKDRRISGVTTGIQVVNSVCVLGAHSSLYTVSLVLPVHLLS